MILPQVQVLRDLMDIHAMALFCQPAELPKMLGQLHENPRLVITDSQAFQQVSAMVPEEVAMTSFSVVLARQKGLFREYLEGTKKLESLSDGDHVLLLESCTHNVTCEDIGRVKLPSLITKHSGRQLSFDVAAGLSALVRPAADYALVLQCGGCVASPKQLASRLAPFVEAGIPVSNYGLAIAYITGIFSRSMQIFNEKG